MTFHRKQHAALAALVAGLLHALPGTAAAGDWRDELRDLGRWLQDYARDRERERYDDETKRLPAQWWQWASSIPPSVNPLNEDTPADDGRCAVGQRGGVWFLAGASKTGAYSRNCTVPANVELFFPIRNQIIFDSPGHCGQEASDSFGAAQMREWAAGVIDGVTQYTVTVDSVPLKRRAVRRLRSEVFAVSLPQDNQFVAGCAELTEGPKTMPGGIYAPAIDDGIYARIGKLSPGEHVLHFTMRSGEGDGRFDLDVTYRLTVVPVRLD